MKYYDRIQYGCKDRRAGSAAGKYAFFVAYDPRECTLIFSRNSTSWGSFFYDPKEDALRVKVKPGTARQQCGMDEI